MTSGGYVSSGMTATLTMSRSSTITEDDHTMKRQIPLVRPGVILLEDWLKPMGLSQYALAKAIGVPARRINEIVKGMRGITVATALRLGAYFGTDAQSWLNLQDHYDTERTREQMAAILKRIARRESLNT
jgi:addiction module HigA family antidote